MFIIDGTDEVAVTSLNFSDPGDDTWSSETALGSIITATQGAALAARMNTLLTSANMLWADYSRLAGVRFAAIGTNGLELGFAKLYATGTSEYDGNNADVVPQATIVVSLRSMQFGPGANYGRMYLPHTSMALLTNSPFADPADVSAFATAAETFAEGTEDDLNTVIAADVNAMIMSYITGRQSRRVASIAVGNLVDTQRRRRNALPETYVFRSLL